MTELSPNPDITGVVLAGGRARRMGGRDKGLVELAGRPMVEYVLDALVPQVAAVLINANRSHARYAAYGCDVVADGFGDFSGPLAGMASAMAYATTPFILTVPCDTPLLPAALAQRLSAALGAQGADLAVAHDGERMQPVFALLRVALLADLRRALEAGERKIDRWYGAHRVALADFSDVPEAFVNVNSPEELDTLGTRLRAPSVSR